MQDGKSLGYRVSTTGGKDIPLMWEWHDKPYLGGAHGVSGILHTLNLVPNFLSIPENRVLITGTVNCVCQHYQTPDGQFRSSSKLFETC